MTDTENTWFWQDYWAQGQMACCLSADLRQGYDGPLAAAWRSFFLSVPDSAKVLDLCTGNGGVAVLAAAVARETGRSFDITGVDKAPIDPARQAAEHKDLLASVSFVGNTDVAALPFGDSEFDVVVSQFGIEYAGLEAVAPEIGRVIKPGGQFMLVLHAADGVAERAAGEELALIPSLGSADLHDSLRRALLAVDSLTRGHGTRPQADAAVEAFIGKLEALDARLADQPNQATILTLGRKLLRMFEAMERLPVDQILGHVDASERAVDAHLMRLEALAHAACDEQAVADLCDMLKHGGFEAAYVPIEDENSGKLAWCVRGNKA